MVASGNVGLAFGLVFAAGLSTTIGASVVFCTSLANAKLLAISLGFAAGVMMFVSFSEIYSRKSIDSFEAVNLDAPAAYRYATLCFFGGMLVIAVLDQIVHFIADWAGRRSRATAKHTMSTANLLSSMLPASEAEDSGAAAAATNAVGGTDSSLAPQQQRMPSHKQQQSELGAEGGFGGADAELGSTASGSSSSKESDDPALVGDIDVPQDALQVAAVQEQAAQCGTTSRQPPAVVEIMKSDHHNWALKKMGVLTGLAIFIHNFPEGLATFVGALADTQIGIGIATAIALHNIPEGVCVAMPIYYATGSKWKGFVWAFLSGISEPVGGLLGYLVLQDNQDLAFAIVFGLVAGMMVYISVKELIPTALKYDPDDKVVTTSVIVGMAIMAGSLLLFTL